MRGVIFLKRTIAILLALIVLLCGVFAGCKKDKNNEADTTTIAEELEDAENEVGFENVEVTDENGKAVTDKNGDKVTTEVAVEYERKGNRTVAYVIDKNGNRVKGKNGKDVTVKTNYKKQSKKTTKKKKKKKKSGSNTPKPADNPVKPDDKTPAVDGKGTTSPVLTTNPKDLHVPTTNDSGKSVSFNANDTKIITAMLEVPYLFNANYEGANGKVPINIASHAAIWMAQQEGLTMSTYASGTVVIDLFKYFGQTVVNFKSQCNSKGDCENIRYNSDGDSFTITAFENKVQDVTITEIQSLGGNNFYKVIGTVKNAGGKDKVVAVVQKNKLDSKLGFSIKALKWS